MSEAKYGYKLDDGSWWLHSYWFTLEGTGVDEVDAILSCVARAGKGSHNTENWEEYGYIGALEDAAQAAADRLRPFSDIPSPEELRKALDDYCEALYALDLARKNGNPNGFDNYHDDSVRALSRIRRAMGVDGDR